MKSPKPGQKRPKLEPKQTPTSMELKEVEDEIRSRLFAEIEHDPVKVQQLTTGLESLRQILNRDQKSGLESVAIEQIVTAWTQTTVSALRLQEFDPARSSAQEGSFWERRHHLAQSRLLRSMDFLDRLRRVPITFSDPENVVIRVEYVDMPDYRRSLGAG